MDRTFAEFWRTLARLITSRYTSAAVPDYMVRANALFEHHVSTTKAG